MLCPVHRVKHLIGAKGSVVNKIMTRTGTGIVVEAEVIPAFTRVNKSAVDAQIVSIKGSKEGTIIAQVSHREAERARQRERKGGRERNGETETGTETETETGRDRQRQRHGRRDFFYRPFDAPGSHRRPVPLGPSLT